MWIFLPFGFFSIASHRERPHNVLVRARVRADLERFVERLYTTSKPAIVHTPNADYPYRAEVSKLELASLLEYFVEDELTYDKVKPAIASGSGPERSDTMLGIWNSTFEFEDAGARKSAAGPHRAAAAHRKSV
jgi:hypothetical protein